MADLNETSGRIPFEWVEIDQPQCLLAYGVGLCEAVIPGTGSDKCFNTRATCQDPLNYDQTATVKTLYFCRPQSNIPSDQQYEPYLKNVSVSASKINPGGGNKSTTALGNRATISISMEDRPHDDTQVDPYIDERAYIAYDRATYWTKWRARNPYYTNMIIRYKSGYIDTTTGLPDPATLITRTFFMSGFNGVSSNNTISIQGKDILSLAADNKATAPKKSETKLLAGINNSVTALTLTPAGQADLEGWELSGKIRVNNEVMSFDRATGADALTIVRAENNTEAADHSTDDAIQLCYEVSSDTPGVILVDLLSNYTEINQATYYPNLSSEATAEGLTGQYSTIITKPVGIIKLLSELCEQISFFLYWNERTAKIEIKSVRPFDQVLDSAITPLTDQTTNLKGSINWKDRPEMLNTQVWFYYSQLNPTEPLNEERNYQALDVIVDTDAETSDKHDTSKIRKIFSRWLTGVNGAEAISTGNKLLARYAHIPREVTFSLDAKDNALWITDFITLTNRNLVDQYGEEFEIPLQVTSAQESIQGTTFSYTAIEYQSDYEVPESTKSVNLTVDGNNVNLREAFDLAHFGYEPVSGDVITFTIRSATTIGGDARFGETHAFTTTYNSGGSFSVAYLQRQRIAAPRSFSDGGTYNEEDSISSYGTTFQDVEEVPLSTSLITGSEGADWLEGVNIELIILSGCSVLGEGGNSSMGRVDGIDSGKGIRGGDAGCALGIEHPLYISNSGTIAAGGGGGEPHSQSTASDDIVVSGGGGAGRKNSTVAADGKNVGSSPPVGGTNTNGGLGFLSAVFGIFGSGGGLNQDGNDYSSENERFGVKGDAIEFGADLITTNLGGDASVMGDIQGTQNNELTSYFKYLLVDDLDDSDSAGVGTFTRATTKTTPTGLVGSTATIGEFLTGAPAYVATHFFPNVITAAGSSSGNYAPQHGLLIEPAATNIILRSEEFDNASWSKTRGSIIADDIASPLQDSPTTADRCTTDGLSSGSGIAIKQNFTITSGADVTVSCYMKAGTGASVSLAVQSNPLIVPVIDPLIGNSGRVVFDLTNGTSGAASSSGNITVTNQGMYSVGNGWFYCWISCSTTALTAMKYVFLRHGAATDDGSDYFYLWGAQVTETDSPKSYIATTTTAATTNKDQLTIPLSTLPDYGAGTSNNFVIDFFYTPKAIESGDNFLISFQDANDGVNIGYTPSTDVWFFNKKVGGVNSAVTVTEPVTGTVSMIPGYKYRIRATCDSVLGMTLHVYFIDSSGDKNNLYGTNTNADDVDFSAITNGAVGQSYALGNTCNGCIGSLRAYVYA